MTKSSVLPALAMEIIPRPPIPDDAGLSYHLSVFTAIMIPCFQPRAMVFPLATEKEGGLRVNMYFRHHRQRGPVNALQMRLQG